MPKSKYAVSVSYLTEFEADSEADAMISAAYTLQYRSEPITNISLLAELKMGAEQSGKVPAADAPELFPVSEPTPNEPAPEFGSYVKSQKVYYPVPETGRSVDADGIPF